MQRNINKEALAKLMKYAEGADEEARQSLLNLELHINELDKSSQKDPFKVMLKALRVLIYLKARVGGNCFGGKDRTGYLMALLTYSFLSNLKSASKELLSVWKKQLVSATGNAAKVAMQNAGHAVMKVTRLMLSLYEMNNLQGVASRVKSLSTTAILGIKGVLLKKLSESEAEGQLFQLESAKEV